MGKIFGGTKSSSVGTNQSTSSSSSSNRAYDDLAGTFAPITGQATSGADSLNKLLGGDASGFNAYKAATGFDAAADQGSRAITGNAAAGGLLRSGGTAKALQAFGNNLQNQFAGSYMDRLLQQFGMGTQAGNILSGAGNVSNSNSQSMGTTTSTSKSKPGLGGLIGGLLTGGVA